MTGVVFMETLRRGWRGALWWGIGIAMIAILQVMILGDVDALRQFADLVATMPPFMLQMMGGAEIAFLATPEGYLAGRFFSFLVMIFAIYAVIAGLRVTAGEEDRGILDVHLSAPLPRWRLVVEKVLAHSVLLFGIVLLTLVGVLGGVSTTAAAASINMGRIAEVTLSVFPPALVALAATVLITGVIRSRGTATGIAFGFVVASYFINFIGSSVGDSAVASLSDISFFRYYNAPDLMQGGILWSSVIVLITASVVLVGAGVFAFQRRDVGA